MHDPDGFLITALFKPFMTAVGAVFGTPGIGITSAIAFLVILGTTIGLLTWKMFDLITRMPDRIIRWIGQLLHSMGDEGQGLAQEARGSMIIAGGGTKEATVKAVIRLAESGKSANVQGKNTNMGSNRDAALARQKDHEMKDVQPNEKEKNV